MRGSDASGATRRTGRAIHTCGSLGESVLGGSGTSDGTWLRLDAAGEVRDLIEQTAPFGHEVADLSISVHHGGVIATTEGLADLGQ